jgi:hypothetical protein
MWPPVNAAATDAQSLSDLMGAMTVPSPQLLLHLFLAACHAVGLFYVHQSKGLRMYEQQKRCSAIWMSGRRGESCTRLAQGTASVHWQVIRDLRPAEVMSRCGE